MSLVQAGPLGDRAGVGRQRDQPDRVQAGFPHFAEGFQPDLAVPAFCGVHGVQREGFELVGEVA